MMEPRNCGYQPKHRGHAPQHRANRPVRMDRHVPGSWTSNGRVVCSSCTFTTQPGDSMAEVTRAYVQHRLVAVGGRHAFTGE